MILRSCSPCVCVIPQQLLFTCVPGKLLYVVCSSPAAVVRELCVCSSQQLLHACSCLRWRPSPFCLHRSGGSAGEESSELAPWESDFCLSQPSQLGEAVPALVPRPCQPRQCRINHSRFKCQYSPFCRLPPVMRMRRRQQILRLCVPSPDCCSLPACRARLCARLGVLPRCSRE